MPLGHSSISKIKLPRPPTYLMSKSIQNLTSFFLDVRLAEIPNNNNGKPPLGPEFRVEIMVGGSGHENTEFKVRFKILSSPSISNHSTKRPF